MCFARAGQPALADIPVDRYTYHNNTYGLAYLMSAHAVVFRSISISDRTRPLFRYIYVVRTVERVPYGGASEVFILQKFLCKFVYSPFCRTYGRSA